MLTLGHRPQTVCLTDLSGQAAGIASGNTPPARRGRGAAPGPNRSGKRERRHSARRAEDKTISTEPGTPSQRMSQLTKTAPFRSTRRIAGPSAFPRETETNK